MMSLLQRCLLISLLLHMLLLALFSVVMLGQAIIEANEEEAGMTVAVNLNMSSELDIRQAIRSQQSELPAPTAPPSEQAPTQQATPSVQRPNELAQQPLNQDTPPPTVVRPSHIELPPVDRTPRPTPTVKREAITTAPPAAQPFQPPAVEPMKRQALAKLLPPATPQISDAAPRQSQSSPTNPAASAAATPTRLDSTPTQRPTGSMVQPNVQTPRPGTPDKPVERINEKSPTPPTPVAPTLSPSMTLRDKVAKQQPTQTPNASRPQEATQPQAQSDRPLATARPTTPQTSDAPTTQIQGQSLAAKPLTRQPDAPAVPEQPRANLTPIDSVAPRVAIQKKNQLAKAEQSLQAPTPSSPIKNDQRMADEHAIPNQRASTPALSAPLAAPKSAQQDAIAKPSIAPSQPRDATVESIDRPKLADASPSPAAPALPQTLPARPNALARGTESQPPAAQPDAGGSAFAKQADDSPSAKPRSDLALKSDPSERNPGQGRSLIDAPQTASTGGTASAERIASPLAKAMPPLGKLELGPAAPATGPLAKASPTPNGQDAAAPSDAPKQSRNDQDSPTGSAAASKLDAPTTQFASQSLAKLSRDVKGTVQARVARTESTEVIVQLPKPTEAPAIDLPSLSHKLSKSKPTAKQAKIEIKKNTDRLADNPMASAKPLSLKTSEKLALGTPMKASLLRKLEATRPRIERPALDPLPLPLTPDSPAGSPEIGDMSAPESLAQRSIQQRDKMLKKMGGTKESEEAVSRALAYLSRMQEPDGRWTFVADDREPGRRGRHKHDTALTGLAVLCFLASDHTPDKAGPYRETVRQALQYLIAVQKKDGNLRHHGDMYNQGIATLALAEAAIMTLDDRYKKPALLGVQYIVKAQNPRTGGWRYERHAPRGGGDTSVLGWQAMALHATEALGFEMPDKTREGALRWLDHVSTGKHKIYAGYSNRGATPPMTAEAAFSRVLLGQELSEDQKHEVQKYLLSNRPDRGTPNYYYNYYATLAMHQLQGDAWTKWNQRMRDHLIKKQKRGGRADGSWPHSSRWGGSAGRIYSTAAATLTLEVYYRYVPVADRKKTED